MRFRSLLLSILSAGLLVTACGPADDTGSIDAAPTADSAPPAPDAAPTCADLTCDPNASCDTTGGAAHCVCDAGYSGDGMTCTDDDECADGTDTCDLNATCSNTPGGFTCACDAGYSGDGMICADQDECAFGTDGCDVNATCANTPGSYTCFCNTGWTGDGFTCTDDDECADGTDGCDANATCTNLPGSYTCECNAGWTGDGFTCADDDECADGSDGCDGNATCANTPGSYTCACNPGWTGDGFTCTDLDECTAGADTCDANATCANTIGGYTCACNPGWTGDGFTCTPVSVSGTVLVFRDSDSPAALAAANALGLTTIDTTHGSFGPAFDAGGFDLVVVDVPGSAIAAADQTRIQNWIAGGGRLIFGWWDLDSSAAMAAALGVSTVDYTTWRDIYRDPATPVDFFTLGSATPSPMQCTDDAGDDGDSLTLTAPGFFAARHDSAAGTGAIAVTTGNRVIVNGFLFWDCRNFDNDGDGISNAQEIATNEILYLLTRRGGVLIYNDSGDTVADEAAGALGLSFTLTTDEGAFTAAYDAGGFQVILIDAPSIGLPAGLTSRLASWIAGGGKVIFAWWNLATDPGLAATLGVTTSAGFDAARSVHRDPTSSFDFYNMAQSLPTPLACTDQAGINGQELTLGVAGFLAARFDTATGPGAVAVTNGQHTIVNGFLPWDCRTVDADADSRPDMRELYENQLTFLSGR